MRKFLNRKFVFRLGLFWSIAVLILILVLPFVVASGIFSYLTETREAKAAVPTILNYQGRLADSNGDLLGGSGTDFDFRFSIYDASSSGTKLWPSSTPSTMTIQVKEGVFNVGIGDTTASGDALTVDIFDNEQIYLQVEVSNAGAGSFEIFTPRQRIWLVVLRLDQQRLII